MSLRRIAKELKDGSPDPTISASPIGDDMYKWQGCIVMDEEAVPFPFDGATFMFSIDFPSDYPFKPPRCILITKIYHPNFSSNGGHCLDILSTGWSPALTIWKVLLSLKSLISNPEPGAPMEPGIAQHYQQDFDGWSNQARAWAFKYADASSPRWGRSCFQRSYVTFQHILNGDVSTGKRHCEDVHDIMEFFAVLRVLPEELVIRVAQLYAADYARLDSANGFSWASDSDVEEWKNNVFWETQWSKKCPPQAVQNVRKAFAVSIIEGVHGNLDDDTRGDSVSVIRLRTCAVHRAVSLVLLPGQSVFWQRNARQAAVSHLSTVLTALPLDASKALVCAVTLGVLQNMNVEPVKAQYALYQKSHPRPDRVWKIIHPYVPEAPRDLEATRAPGSIQLTWKAPNMPRTLADPVEYVVESRRDDDGAAGKEAIQEVGRVSSNMPDISFAVDAQDDLPYKFWVTVGDGFVVGLDASVVVVVDNT